MSKFSLQELAKAIGAELAGDPSLRVAKIALLSDADEHSLVYLQDPGKLDEAEASKAGALLVSPAIQKSKKPILISENPKLAFAKALRLFHPRLRLVASIHPTAVIHETATIGTEVSIEAYAVIGPNVRVGNGVHICPFAFIDDRAVVGDDTVLHARATVLHEVEVGKRCVLYEGCVIGSEGFGYVVDEHGKHLHVPQAGTVILEDEVEIGANTTIDRATLGATRIKRGSKIDNLVQIAHNCVIEENCVVAAMTGIAGSVMVGAGSMIGGHVGIRDHSRIGEKAIIGGGSNVWGDVDSASFVSGIPARLHKEQLKIYALQHKLPELIKRLEALEKKQQ